MLRARCISEGIRTVYPGCVVGTYTAEELEEIPAPTETSKILEVVEEVVKQYKLWIPDREEPYASYDTPEEWNEGFNSLVSRIKTSSKFAEEVKEEKLDGLRACNLDMLDFINPMKKEVK
jgi:hypothetical protein